MTPTRTWLALPILLAAACASPSPPPAAAPAPAPPMTSAAPPAAAPAPAAVPVSAPAARPPEAIIADSEQATGGAAWNAHKTMHARLELTFQGMGISGTGERFATSADKALTTTDLPGIGLVRDGSNGSVLWAQDPVNGLRLLEGAEAEEARFESAWNPEQHMHDFFVKMESRPEVGPGGTPLECVVLTPKLAHPRTNCYDPATHLQVSEKGTRSTPQGDTPYSSVLKDWHEVGGVKIAFAVDTQAGPITYVARMTDVKFDEPVDDKLFEPPTPPGATSPAEPTGKTKAAPKPKTKVKPTNAPPP